jgi:hypothetical protein
MQQVLREALTEIQASTAAWGYDESDINFLMKCDDAEEAK